MLDGGQVIEEATEEELETSNYWYNLFSIECTNVHYDIN